MNVSFTFYVKLGNTKLRYVLSWGMNVKLEVLFCNSCFGLSYDCLGEVESTTSLVVSGKLCVCDCVCACVCKCTCMWDHTHARFCAYGMTTSASISFTVFLGQVHLLL